MIKKVNFVAALVPLLFLATTSWAQMTPVGTWRTVDDKTGKQLAEIRIADKGNGELFGVNVRSLVPPVPGGDPNCSKCTDDRKDKPKLGIELIRGAKQTADTQTWEGGTILDPNEGKIYRLRLMPLEGGTKLQVRGYIGVFYRTQVWTRVDATNPTTNPAANPPANPAPTPTTN
jgi:uncharacterized protein (DUF2147 family)